MTIEIIKNCPSCNSKLERVSQQLFCRNPSCGDKRRKVVEGFAKKVRIKGLGEKTIEKLNLTSIQDIYELDEKTVIDTIGEKLGIKLMKEIEKAKSMSLGTFLSACSIYLIGTSVGAKIDAITNNPNDLNFKLCRDIGIGEKASQSLMNWLETEYIDFPIQFTELKEQKDEPTKLKVCITGRLSGYTKATAAEKLKAYNIEVVSTVNKADVLLLSERKGSAKEIQAEKLNKEILTMDELLNKLEK